MFVSDLLRRAALPPVCFLFFRARFVFATLRSLLSDNLRACKSFSNEFVLRLRLDPNHILRLAVSHKRSHTLVVWTPDMGVSIENKLAAVAMALPFRNHLHVNAALDCAHDEHPSQCSVREGGQS